MYKVLVYSVFFFMFIISISIIKNRLFNNRNILDYSMPGLSSYYISQADLN